MSSVVKVALPIIGAIVGSVIPGLGTALGASLGGAVGGYVGGRSYGGGNAGGLQGAALGAAGGYFGAGGGAADLFSSLGSGAGTTAGSAFDVGAADGVSAADGGAMFGGGTGAGAGAGADVLGASGDGGGGAFANMDALGATGDGGGGALSGFSGSADGGVTGGGGGLSTQAGPGQVVGNSGGSGETMLDRLRRFQSGKGVLRGEINFGTGALGLLRAAQLKKAADPFGKYREQYAAELQALEANPSSITTRPGYQAGLQAVQRAGAAQGYTGSGNMAAGLAGYGQNFFEQQRQLLASLGGAGAPVGQGAAAGYVAENNAWQGIGNGAAGMIGP